MVERNLFICIELMRCVPAGSSAIAGRHRYPSVLPYSQITRTMVRNCPGATMPIYYLSGLTARPRTGRADLHIGVILTLVAGALNAGGFLAIGQYTSHMTGMVSSFADQIVLRNIGFASVAAMSWCAFVAGAATTALIVNYLQRAQVSNPYAVPLLIEAVLVLVFGTFGGTLQKHE